MLFALTPLAAPLPLLVVGLVARRSERLRPRLLAALAEGSALFALGVSLGSLAVLWLQGPGDSPLLGAGEVGLSVRLDAVSVTMLLLVAFVGWVVVRYSRTYLDGEPRQAAFTGTLCLALGAVLLLVQSGNLVQLGAAWIGMSVCVDRLLLFYPRRVSAQRAARKKKVSSIGGAMALVSAAILLVVSYGATDIATINAAARTGEAPWTALAAAGLLALAAILKSAQFPTHGWLTEVMEAPTPVSALLHAGVINAGGFLLIRFADLMVATPGILAVLAIVGGFTALFGAVVMLTQTAVKTSLAWSTVAQMGFMILQCGLALFPLALLHLVAHSLYKAHAFLAAGGAVERVASIARPGPVATPNEPRWGAPALRRSPSTRRSARPSRLFSASSTGRRRPSRWGRSSSSESPTSWRRASPTPPPAR